MANDNDIGFKVYALIDGLKEQMGQAGVSVKNFTESAHDNVNKLGGAFTGLNGIIAGFVAVLAGGAIFRESISATIEWTGEVRNLARNFGITTEEASGLALALDAIEVSTDDYRGAASKLDRQIKSNEAQVNALGVATRDQNGNLLSQQELMLNAITTLKGYKEGTDRNVASMYLFGRGAGELGNLLRLNNKELEEGAADAKKFGLVVSEQSNGEVQEYKRAINDVGDAFTGLKVLIGNAIMPLLTKLAKFFTDDIVPAIGSFVGKIQEMVKWWDEVGYSVQAAIDKTRAYFGLAPQYQGRPGMYGAKSDWGGLSSEDDIAKAKEFMKNGQITDNRPGSKTVPAGFDDKQNTDKQKAQERIQLAQQAAQTEMQLSKIALQQRKDDLAAGVAAGQITKQQEIQMLRDYLEEEYAEKREALIRLSQLKGLSVLDQKKTNDQILLLDRQHEADVQKLKQQSIAAQMGEYRKLFSVIRTSFASSIQGILQGTQTWQQAMQNIFSNLLSSFIGFVADMLMNWIETQILMAIFGETVAGASDRATIAGHAATAGAGAYAATAVIPVIGPALAPGAAAAAYAGAMTFQMLVPAAKMGFDIPKGVNPLTQLHEEEMVLPAPLANAVRDMAANGSGSSGGGDIFHFNISAIDTRSGAQFIKEQAAAIAKAVKGEMRNHNPALTGMKG